MFFNCCRYVLPVIAALIFSFQAGAENVRVFLSYSNFYSPVSGPYVETYLTILGNSIVYVKNANHKFQGELEVKMIFKQGDSVKIEKKYTVLSLEMEDTNTVRSNFVDVQRVFIPEGLYNFEIQVSDKNKAGNTLSSIQKLSTVIDKNKIDFSGIEMLESYSKTTTESHLSKSGYNLNPYVSNIYPQNMDKLAFYAEVYNAQSVLGVGEKFVIGYYIESDETKIHMSGFGTVSVQKTSEVNVLLSSIFIKELPSGNYNLVIYVKDKNNTVLKEKKISFLRINPKTELKLDDISSLKIDSTFVAKIISKDTLSDFIKSLRAISRESEKTFSEHQLQIADLLLMQQYFLNFWKKRNEFNPEGEWLAYYKDVKKANELYGNMLFKGYDTDRGRVYLKYGEPTYVQRSLSEPTTYPYEIWQYGITNDKQVNRQFIFYNKTFVGSNYRLLHSDAIGELQNPNWQSILNKGNSIGNDQLEEDPYGGRTKQNYLNTK